jgi:hypothetical protein
VPAPAEPAPERGPGDPRPEPPLPAAEDAEPERTQADIGADAKLYAAIYPDRVRRIRAAGGMPADLDFGPPEPEIVNAILQGAGGAVLSHPTRHDPMDRNTETELKI